MFDKDLQVSLSIMQEKNAERRRAEKWSWLPGILEERRLAEKAAKDEARAQGWTLGAQKAQTKVLPPFPATTMQEVGWLSTKPEFKLEVYANWHKVPPLRPKDSWED